MKKFICLLMVLTLMAGICGCGEESTATESNTSAAASTSASQAETTAGAQTTTASEIPVSDDYQLVGDIVSFDDDGYLDDYDTIRIAIPGDISEEDYDSLMGVYMGEDYTYYYLPDPEALRNGEVVFETLHHCNFGSGKVDKKTLINEWAKRASVNIVTRNTANGKIESSLGDVVNGVLEDLNLSSNTYGGNVLEYVLSQDTKGEILQAALNGDQTTLQQKTASLIADAIFDEGLISGGDAVDIISAYTNEDNWAEGAVALSKEIQKKIFPEIDAAGKFADLVDKTFDVWASNTMDEVFRTQYAKSSVSSDGSIPDNEWQTIYSCIRGAWARYNSKGISEEMLRSSFEQRAKNENLISEKETELNELVKEWDKSGFLTYSSFSDYTDWTMADRLQSLYQSRQTIIKMFTKDGKLQKGALSNWSDEDFINYVHMKWTQCGIKKRNEFYKWLQDEGITEKPDGNAGYAWVLINTEIYQHENLDGSYIETFTAAETTHTYQIQGTGRFDYDKGSFTATCEAPPATIYADQEFSMNLSISASGESDLFYLANAWITMGGNDHLKTKDGEGTFTVGTYEGADRSFDVTVYGTAYAGAEGNTMEIKFCACQSDTTWTYEWKKAGN